MLIIFTYVLTSTARTLNNSLGAMAEPESSILIHSTGKILVRNSYKIDDVTLWPLMTTYKYYRLALQTNTSILSAL